MYNEYVKAENEAIFDNSTEEVKSSKQMMLLEMINHKQKKLKKMESSRSHDKARNLLLPSIILLGILIEDLVAGLAITYMKYSIQIINNPGFIALNICALIPLVVLIKKNNSFNKNYNKDYNNLNVEINHLTNLYEEEILKQKELKKQNSDNKKMNNRKIGYEIGKEIDLLLSECDEKSEEKTLKLR